MSEQPPVFLPMPGLEVVGRGVYLQPYQPYQLRQILFKRDNLRSYRSSDTAQPYGLPMGYEVNDSPPMPASQALNQTRIDESWERFNKQNTLDANAAVSGGVFTVSGSTSAQAQMRSDEEAYYASRSSFLPLWSVYLTDLDLCVEELEAYEVPVPFSHSQRRAYDQFFDRFGSHFIRQAWVGGKAELLFTIAKSTNMSKEDIQAGLKASYGMGSGASNAHFQESKERLRNNAQCSVTGCGGDEVKLACLSSLDEAVYNEWLKTIRNNPQTIEMEVVGIWTLFKDAEKAKAIQEAYRAATAFTPISAVYSSGRIVTCIKGRYFFRYDIDTGTSEKPRLLTELYPELERIGFERVDGAVTGDQLVGPNGEPLKTKLFLFRREYYVCIDALSGTVEEGYPKLIRDGWPGMPFDQIDASCAVGRSSLYFFRGDKYVRFDTLKHRVDEGYPDLVRKRWPGVIFDRIDDAIYWGNGKVFFFRNDQHIRFDLTMCRADPGYPKSIVGDYVDDWKFFN